ncbi:TPA: restriction endonuclease subunit S [Streptococcus suis]|nr:restriction endonuclease subunit S [Streptococcus suis]
MKTNNNIPAYRFQGYTDAWELRKLVNEVLFIGTGKSKFSALEFGEFEILGSTSVIGYDNSYDYEGDFILTARVGANAGELYRHSGKVKISDNTVFIQGDGLDFIFYILQHFDIKKLSFGTGQPLVKASELKELKIFMPVSVKERNHIGTFFSTLDRQITLHQRKLDTLKEQKKTYLKLLFPAKGQTKPALRFQGFEDDWKEVKLGEVLIKNSKRNKDLRIINVESVSNRLGFVKQTEQFEDYSVASSDLSNYYVISEKQFAYNPSRINVGSIAYKKLGEESSVVSPLYVSFSTSENVEDYYLWYWFKTELFHSQRIVFSEGGVRDTLSYNQLSEIILSLPSLPEQEVIGTFFSTLDQEIAQVEDKLASLKEMKKTLLRKLFV